MLQNNNFSVLPFYPSKSYWHSRKPYAYGLLYPLITPANSFPTFQLTRDIDLNADDYTYLLYKASGAYVKDITQTLVDTGLAQADHADLVGCITYSALTPHSLSLPEGPYYIEVRQNSTVYAVSEVFTIVKDVSNCVLVEWWDEEDLAFDSGFISYANNFKHKLYIQADIGRPKYSYDEEGESRGGYYFAEKQLSEKTYKFAFVAPEYLCDAVRFTKISDNVRVAYQGITYLCDTFLPTFEWEEQGDLASIEVEFKTATAVKKLAAGYLRHQKGHFSGDFNNDFSNK